MDKLLNCPFCGGKAIFEGVYLDYSTEWLNVECEDCECKTDDFKVPKQFCKASTSETEDKAAAVWNKRV